MKMKTEADIQYNGSVDVSSFILKEYSLNHELLWEKLRDYLGLGNEERYCGLKGFFLKREEDKPVGYKTTLEGTWFSGTPCSAIITRYFEFYNCSFTVLNRNGKIDRIYKYQIVPISNNKTELHLEMIQTYNLSLWLLLNPELIQRTFNEIFKRLVPYGLYDDINPLLPRLFNSVIADEAVPSGYLPHKFKWKIIEWLKKLTE